MRQRFIIDLRLELKEWSRPEIRLEESVDYAEVIRLVREMLEVPGDLIENTAHRLGHAVMDRFEALDAVWVRISKKPQVRQVLQSVSYECTVRGASR